MSDKLRTDLEVDEHLLDCQRDRLRAFVGGGKIKRVVGCLFAHLVLMVVSYMLAQRCGDTGNPAAGIWFAVASLFFFFVGTVCFIEAMSLASQGMESQQEQERQQRRKEWQQRRQQWRQHQEGDSDD
jgi:hypothetical protein